LTEDAKKVKEILESYTSGAISLNQAIADILTFTNSKVTDKTVAANSGGGCVY
jgi:hypothetical protein